MIDARTIRERMVMRAKAQQDLNNDQEVDAYEEHGEQQPIAVVFVEREPMRMWDRLHGMSHCLSNKARRLDRYEKHGPKKPRYKNHRKVGRKMWASI